MAAPRCRDCAMQFKREEQYKLAVVIYGHLHCLWCAARRGVLVNDASEGTKDRAVRR